MTVHIAPTTETAARQIERRLRKSIVELELLPGEKLSEQEIAERFGVSRQPVREALIALARAELVSVMPQRGTAVVKISGARMLQARFIRETIEVSVVRRACETGLDPVYRESLAEMIALQAAALARGDVAGFKSFDERFHELLATGAGIDLAWRVIGDIKSHLDRVCHLTLCNAAAMEPLIGQHQAILDAVVARDADAAEAAMRFHLTEILRAMPRVMAERGELFA